MAMRSGSHKVQRVATAGNGAPTVAILHSQDLIDEWLDHLGISLEDVEAELMGSWIFGYAQALSSAGARPLLVFVTSQVTRPERSLHRPTGAAILLVPPPRAYLPLRSWLERGPLAGRRLADLLTRNLLPYLATPLRTLTRLLRQERCAAIICQEYETPRFDHAVLLGRLVGVPVFPSFHAGDRRARPEGILHRMTVPACAGLIISADAEEERVRRKYRVTAGMVGRIPNPVDLEIWRPADRSEARTALDIAQDASVVVWHGAVYLRLKGLDLIVEAWDRLTRERPDRDLRLILVGGGADSPELKHLIATRRLRGVRFDDGWLLDRSRLRLYLSAGDVYVSAARNGDGRELAVTEAMACGLPIVASELIGSPDTLGRNGAAAGIIVPKGDPQALAGALGRLLDDDDLRRQYALRARERVRQGVSVDAVGAQMLAFLSARGMKR
jgi:starch synthase